MRDLAERVQSLEANGRLAGERAAAEQQHPQFSITLQSALVRAAQTENREKHQLLADLIAERLVSEGESLTTLASQMAVDAIALATPRQLRLLALCPFVEEIRPRDAVDNHCLWLDVCLRPFEELEFYRIDAMHLAALSCVLFDQTSEKDLAVSLGLNSGGSRTVCFPNRRGLSGSAQPWRGLRLGLRRTMAPGSARSRPPPSNPASFSMGLGIIIPREFPKRRIAVIIVLSFGITKL